MPALRLLIFFLAAPPGAAVAVVPGTTVFDMGSEDHRYQTRRHLRYEVVVQNPTDRVVAEAEVWVSAPVLRTGNQQCLRLETTHPGRLEVDELGNQVLRFQVRNLVPHTVKIIAIRADLAMSKQPIMVGAGDPGTFLGPSRNIESDHPEIVALAATLGRTPGDALVETIYRWVADNVTYAGYQSDARGALYTLRNKRGDCTEYADLFVALSRASGIPARGVAGYVYEENSILSADDFHDWGEYYSDGAWQIADPQKRAFGDRQDQYIAFRIMGPAASGPLANEQRFRVSVEDLVARMN